MTTRTAAVLLFAAVVFCTYSNFAQEPGEPKPGDGAIVVGAPLHLNQQQPGRYQLTPLTSSSVMVIDTHTGRCWSKSIGQAWRDWGTPADQK